MTLKHLFKTSLLLLPAAGLLAAGCSDDETAGPVVPPVSPSEPFMEQDDVLFACDFQNINEVRELLKGYEFSGNTYSPTMQSLGFNAANPWLFQLRDGALTTNTFAGTSSSFSPAGTADAWLVTRAITLPDTSCVLTWKSESLTPGRQDGLKVFVSTTGGNPETDFPATPAWEIAEEESGPTENLDGEWVDHSLSLKAYGGQTVYIAFVNQSTDKSMICLDDICVKKPMAYEVSDKTAPLVASESIEIKGSIRATDRPITAFTVHYTTADSIVRSETFTNVNIQPGSEFDFAFSEKLTPAEQGRYVSYRLWANVEGCTNVGVTDSVASVAFVPETKAVLEEGTGMWCGYCPRGFVGLELMNEKYPDLFVGVSYHNGDILEIMSSTEFPSDVPGFPDAWLDRVHETDAYHGDDYSGYGFALDDVYLARSAEIAPASVDVTAEWADDAQQTINVTGTVTFIKDVTGVDYRMAYILVADDLHGEGQNWLQSNYFSGDTNYAESEGMDVFVNGGSSVAGLHYNDVAVLTSDIKGIAGSLPSDFKTAAPETCTYQFNVADAVNTSGENIIQDKSKLRVVAVLVDAATGEVLNSNKCNVGGQGGTGIAATLSQKGEIESVEYFDASGRRVSSPSNGLYIKSVKYSDGSVRTSKVVLK